MNLTNIKYLYDLMDKEGFSFFTVYDSKGSPMRDQANPEYSVSDAKEDLSHFLEYNSGVFRVEFRRTKANNASTKNYSFTIDNLKTENSDNAGIGNVGLGMQPDFMRMIQEKDKEIKSLQSEMFASMMAASNKHHELQIEMLRKELKSDDGGNNDALMSSAISALSGMFGGGSNIALSGVSTMENPIIDNTNMSSPIVDDNKKKINAAVVSLIANDSNFAENITKLAKLCAENPMIYKMAIQKLDSI